MLVNLKPYLYTKGTDEQLDNEYAAAVKFGKIKLGATSLFWRAGLKQYVICLDNVQRIRRGINSVGGRRCAGGRNYDMEYLVLTLKDDTELVLHIIDDSKQTALDLMDALQKNHPELKYGKE